MPIAKGFGKSRFSGEWVVVPYSSVIKCKETENGGRWEWTQAEALMWRALYNVKIIWMLSFGQCINTKKCWSRKKKKRSCYQVRMNSLAKMVVECRLEAGKLGKNSMTFKIYNKLTLRSTWYCYLHRLYLGKWQIFLALTLPSLGTQSFLCSCYRLCQDLKLETLMLKINYFYILSHI